MSEDINRLKEEEKAKDSHEYETVTPAAGRDNDNESSWIVGVVLITIGAIFLVSNLTSFHLDNWWALFILIPAVANFNNAWRHYQRDGELTRPARGAITGGLILTLITSAFLFDLDWGLIWPIFLVIGGLAVLMNGWFD